MIRVTDPSPDWRRQRKEAGSCLGQEQRKPPGEEPGQEEQGCRKGGLGGRGGANFIHFLYKVLGSRSVQKEPL